MKTCSVCKKAQPLNSFYKHPQTLDGRGSQCKACDTAGRNRRRREVKERLVAHFGGACTRCGYNKSVMAMDFHHVGQKDFEISRYGTFEKLLKEAQKCMLVCANCHRELHELEHQT